MTEASVTWRRLDLDALEHVVLARGGDGWSFDGVIVGAARGAPLRTRYRLDCDDRLRIRRIDLERRHGLSRDVLHANVEGDRWSVEGHDLAALRGCVGVDLGGTPVTNTLAIRALSLPIGRSAEIAVAFADLDPPAPLAFSRAVQRYTRLDEDRYRYESVERGRVANACELEVDPLGVVVRYEGYWERVARA